MNRANSTPRSGERKPRFDVADLKRAARGRWLDILVTVGCIASAILDGKHHPCPKCGGKDRFRLIDADEGACLCNQCFADKNGDGLSAIQWLLGIDFPSAISKVADYLGLKPSQPRKKSRVAQPKKSSLKAQVTLNKLKSASTEDDGTISKYLKSRGLSGHVPQHVRLHSACDYFHDGKLVGQMPAMLASVVSPKRKLVGYHRTFLANDGSGKADVEEAKKLTASIHDGSYQGAFIPLYESGETLAIAEGIETAIAVSEATGTPAWAAISSSTMKGVWIPEHVNTVELWGDPDAAGRDAAESLAQRLQAEGKTVYVIIPATEGEDWLDLLNVAGPEVLKVARESAKPWEQVWETPTPLATEVPEFSSKTLPRVLSEFIEAESVATQTPPDMAALLSLAVCAAALAKKVEVKVRDGWIEPVNIYVATILEPGNRKSAVFSDAQRPIRQFEADLIREAEQEVRQAQVNASILKTRLEKFKKQAATADDPSEREHLTREASALAEELNALDLIQAPRLLADDCTNEKLGIILVQQHGRIASMSPEGGVFDLMAGLYATSGMPSFVIYLMGHAGDDIRIDRVSREGGFVKKPALTMGLAIQPAVISGLIDKSAFRGRGLLGRFLYSVPGSWMGNRDVNPPPVPDDVYARYCDLVRKLCELPLDLDENREVQPRYLRVSAEAHNLALIPFMEELEPQLGIGGELDMYQDWGAKLAGAVVRLAGILHCVSHTDAPWSSEISKETMLSAIDIGEYLIPHAKRTFEMMNSDGNECCAELLLRWIKLKQLTEFTKRDAHRSNQKRFQKAEELDGPLAQLIEHNYLRETPTSKHGPGRKASPHYAVNPAVLDSDSVISVTPGAAPNPASAKADVVQDWGHV